MMKHLAHWVVVFCLAVGVLACVNTTDAASPIYVNDAIGNDLWPGDTSSSPVKTIQKGINLVDVNGEVLIAAGTYVEDIWINKSVSVNGASSDTVIIQPVGSQLDLYYGAPTHVLITASNVTLSNVQLSGDETLCDEGIMIEDSDDVKIFRCNIHNYYSDAIYALEGTMTDLNTGIEIRNNHIHHIRENDYNIGWLPTVINFENSGGIIAENIIEESAVTYAISFYIDTGWADLADAPLITTNTLENIYSPTVNLAPDLNRAIIAFAPAEIYGNTIRNANFGIQVQLQSGASAARDGDISITNNKLYDLRPLGGGVPAVGIYLNSIVNQAARNVLVANNIVDGVNGLPEGGVGLYTWLTTEGNILWRNNYVNGFGKGADFRQNAAPTIFRNNILNLSPADNSPLFTENGMHFYQASAAAVEGNLISGFDVAVQVDNDGSLPDLGGGALASMGRNDFSNYTTFPVKNDGAAEIKAENNYWGTISWFGYAAVTGIKDRPNGAVDWEPWSDSTLTAAYSKPATLYVDDNNLGSLEEVAGASGGIFGYNAFDTIQDGVNNAVDAAVVNVQEGSYNESVLIAKPINLKKDDTATTLPIVTGAGQN
ncbi:MAG TPA: hypothetical protein P5245_04100, partial [Candidatus Sumerlaeia bacterium]|nr:hypothetical protein [Candidatus Sumerlaeia bacterium]